MLYITVDTDGVSGDYTHLEDAIPSTFSDDVTITCDASTGVHDAITADLDIPVTDTYTLYIVCTNDYWLELPADYNINISDGFGAYHNTDFHLNCIKTGQTANYDKIIDYTGLRDTTHRLSGRFKYFANTSYRAEVIEVTATGGFSPTLTIENLVVWNVTGSSSIGNSILNYAAIGDGMIIDIVNCTFIGGDVCFYQNGDYITAKNCIFSGQDQYIAYDTDLGSTSYCSTDQSTGLSGTGDRLSQTFTFVGSGDDPYALDSADAGAKGYGIGPALDADVPTTDVIGNSRSGNTCDIGAYETVGSTPVELIVIGSQDQTGTIQLQVPTQLSISSEQTQSDIITIQIPSYLSILAEQGQSGDINIQIPVYLDILDEQSQEDFISLEIPLQLTINGEQEQSGVIEIQVPTQLLITGEQEQIGSVIIGEIIEVLPDIIICQGEIDRSLSVDGSIIRSISLSGGIERNLLIGGDIE